MRDISFLRCLNNIGNKKGTSPFFLGITHFVKIHEDDWKISVKSLCQNYLWHFGVIPIALSFDPHGGLWGIRRLKKWTEGLLGVRLGQVSWISENFFNEVIRHSICKIILTKLFFALTSSLFTGQSRREISTKLLSLHFNKIQFEMSFS
jgi:hypothetical protein